MSRAAVLALSLSLALAPTLFAVEAPLPRHPAPSPDGSQIAFSWQGDIWLVPAVGGQARRVTAHPAAERFPVWSRDGRFIAFASERYGNLDVFVMPTDGSSEPRRLTFASVDDVPTAFDAAGDGVLFTSRRDESTRRMPAIYRVPLVGGTETLVQAALGWWATPSADGSALAYVRGDTEWTRRGYRGSANRDLWLHRSSGEDLQLTDFEGDDDRPGWVDDRTLAFLSARAGRKNLFLLDLTSREARQLTFHDGSDVRFPRLSADGRLLAYEFEDAIWTVPAAGGEPHRLRVDVPADQVRNPRRRVRATDGATELAVSPDGKLAAFVVHGDVFVTAVVSKDDQAIAAPPTVQVTATPERERDISWSPDGARLLFASERGGFADLHTARPADEATPWTESFEFPVERLTSSPEHDHSARFSPDGKLVAFVRGKGTLVVAAADGSGEKVLLEHWEAPVCEWSPDGRWLACSVTDQDYNSEIWVLSAAGGEPYNLSRHPDEDVDPRWSPDGKRLVWATKRHGSSFDVWGAWLTRVDHERTPAEWLKYWMEKDRPKDKGGDAGGREGAGTGAAGERAEPQLPEVKIDLDDLWERARPITDLPGDEGLGLVSLDGKRLVFAADHEGERDLYSVRWDGEDLERLTTGGQAPSEVQQERESKAVFYLDEGGHIRRVGLDGSAGDPVPFAARYEVSTAVERGMVFDEAWRALQEWFYDPAFHGVDWPAQRARYRPWALAASHDDDFADVLNLMLGELNASHMGYYPPDPADPGEVTGWLGAFFDPTAGGPGLLVREVLRDSPAAREDVRLAPGERLLAVNGRPVGEHDNVHAFLADTVRQRVVLTIRAADSSERRAVVVPVSFAEQRQLRYEEWSRQRRRIVDQRSGGRLGYIHIQGMSIPSFEGFERDLYAAASGKDGLIIDVRSNGGGWTTDYLLAVLAVRRHAFTVPRGGDPKVRAYPQDRLPLAAWTRPTLTLCNEESYSNAEIFSSAFRELGRGLVVGTPTFGAVISTGATTTLDEGTVRLPMRGWYVASTGANMENNGTRPDILVEQPPAEDTSADRDTQLERAVEALLAGLESDPRFGAW